MKRACYRKTEDGIEIRHLRSICSDGNVHTEPIQELDGKYFQSLNDVLLSVNMLGYGIVGDMEELKRRTRRQAYVARCGQNLMDIDEL